MRLSTSTNIVHADRGRGYIIPFERSVRSCFAVGYRYIDVSFCGMSRKGKPEAPMTEDSWESSAHSWKELGEELGIGYSQAHAYFSLEGPIKEGEIPGGDFGQEMMRRSVLAAKILEVPWMVVHPVTIVKDDKVDIEGSYRYNLEYFKNLHELFSSNGIGMAIENMTNHRKYPSPFADIDFLMRLIDELNAEDIGTCLDTGHAFLSGHDPAKSAMMMGKKLKATHIADNKGQEDDHLAPFQGNIDWKSFVKALRTIGYKNDFSFEIQNMTGTFPLELQPGLVKLSYELGEYLLSDKFLEEK